MSAEDKAKNLADKAGGVIKETTGRVTGDESLEASGEKLKDGLKDAAE